MQFSTTTLNNALLHIEQSQHSPLPETTAKTTKNEITMGRNRSASLKSRARRPSISNTSPKVVQQEDGWVDVASRDEVTVEDGNGSFTRDGEQGTHRSSSPATLPRHSSDLPATITTLARKDSAVRRRNSIHSIHRTTHTITPHSNSHVVPPIPLSPRTAIGMSSKQLKERWKAQEDNSRPSLIAVDMRNLNAYLGPQGRVRGSINVNFPSLLIKRFRRGNTANFSLAAFITTAAGIDTFQSLNAVYDGHLGDIDILVIDDETVGNNYQKKEFTAGSVIISVLESKDETGRIYYLEGSFQALKDELGVEESKWIVAGEDEDEEGDDIVDHTSVEVTRDATTATDDHAVSRKADQSTATVFQQHSPASLSLSAQTTHSHSTPIDSPYHAALASPSFSLPLLSPRTPGGTNKMHTLGKLDTSDTVLRGGGVTVSISCPHTSIEGITQQDRLLQQPLSAISTTTGTRRKGGLPAPMSIQSLCHSQSQSPSRSNDTSTHSHLHHAHTSQHNSPLPSSLATSASHHPQYSSSSLSSYSSVSSPTATSAHSNMSSYQWIHPSTPKTALSLPPFTVSTIIPNLLYLGPAPYTFDHLEELVGSSFNIKEVINMAVECEDEGGLIEQRMKERGGGYWKIGMRDFVEEVGVQGAIEKGCKILERAEGSGNAVYVHCFAGRSRSATIVLARLIERNNWSLKKAFAYCLERRPDISPNIGFISELMKFEDQVRGERSHGVFGPSIPFPSGSCSGSGSGRSSSHGGSYVYKRSDALSDEGNAHVASYFPTTCSTSFDAPHAPNLMTAASGPQD